LLVAINQREKLARGKGPKLLRGKPEIDSSNRPQIEPDVSRVYA
jgi:hypothetical protein